MNKLILTCVFALASLYVSAQDTDWEVGGIEGEVIIVKDKELTMPPAVRQFAKVVPQPIEKAPELRPFTFGDYMVPFEPMQSNIRVLRLKDEPLDKLYGNYVKLGFGNFVSPYIGASIGNKRSKDYVYGINLRHQSYAKGPVDGKNSGSGRTYIEALGTAFKKNYALSGKVYMDRMGTNFYGYSPDEAPVDRDTIEQHYFIVAAEGTISSVDTEKVDYNLTAGYLNLSDAYDARESTMKVELDASYKFNNENGIEISSHNYFGSYKDGTKQNRTFVGLGAYYYFNHNNINFKAGGNMVYENDTLSSTKDLHFYPHLEASYSLSSWMTVYGSLSGNMERVSLTALAYQNQWLDSDLPIYNTNKTLEIIGGIRGNLGSKSNFDVGVKLQNLENQYFFINNPNDSIKFSLVYEYGTTSVFSLFGDINYIVSDVLALHGGLELNGYNTGTIAHAWHLPTVDITGGVRYNMFDKINLDGSVQYMAGIKAQNPDGTTVTLNAIFDFNAEVEYMFSPRASAFVRFNNIFGKEYERYLNYPSRSLQFLFGVSYAF